MRAEKSICQYVAQQLAATGWVLIDATMAYRLRPDLWASLTAASGRFHENYANLREELSTRCQHFAQVQLPRTGKFVLCAATSRVDLAKRIEWVIGESVKLSWMSPADVLQKAAQYREQERIATLGKSAAPAKKGPKPIPAYECEARRKALRHQDPSTIPAHDCAERRRRLAAMAANDAPPDAA